MQKIEINLRENKLFSFDLYIHELLIVFLTMQFEIMTQIKKRKPQYFSLTKKKRY